MKDAQAALKADLVLRRDKCDLYCGDGVEVLRSFAGETFDAVVTDPPYNLPPARRVSQAVHVRWMSAWLREAQRVTRDAVVFFPGPPNLFDVPSMLEGTRLRVFRVLGWHPSDPKGDIEGEIRVSWEPIIWTTKRASPRFNYRSSQPSRDFFVDATPDVIAMSDTLAGHPFAKPVAVLRWLLDLVVPSHGTVVDPFTGSGTTLVAALSLGLEAVGIESEPAHCEIAQRRIEAL
jgi:site-specific DNA-methyltransferase (adenine-specific)